MESNINLFKHFLPKNSEEEINSTGNCIITTRVSTKDQEDNTSLAYQKERCEEYAKKKGYNIVAYFGGIYESAKNDERKEFKRMMDFVKNPKNKVSRIIVLSFDRFSRSGANAIYLISKLKQDNILVESVTQEADYTTPSGELLQNMQLLFSKLDNDQRRQKSIAGMIEMLKAGYFPNRAPIGYLHVKGADWDNRIVLDPKLSPLINQAFQMKANGKGNTEITRALKAQGWTVNRKRLTDIFANPFYCGVIISSLLPGKIIIGKHPIIVSKELFLLVNNIISQTKYGVKPQKEYPEFPLKQFIRCDDCDYPLTAYHVKGKKATYYKCNTIGCSVNRNATVLHNKLVSKFKDYTYDPKCDKPILELMKRVFSTMNDKERDNNAIIVRQLNSINSKITALTDKLLEGVISSEIYSETMERYKKERDETQSKLNEQPDTLSNLNEYLTATTKLVHSIGDSWGKESFHNKQRLQSLVFPNGLRYNRKLDDYRTPRVSAMFLLPTAISEELENKKSGNLNFEFDFSALVARTGIEPVFRP